MDFPQWHQLGCEISAASSAQRWRLATARPVYRLRRALAWQRTRNMTAPLANNAKVDGSGTGSAMPWKANPAG
jgi:hypothetical protein